MKRKLLHPAIKVRADRVEVEFGNLGNSTSNDLERLHNEILRKFNICDKLFRNSTYITPGVASSPFFKGIEHRRSMFMGDNNSLVVKGSGFNNWQDDPVWATNYGELFLLGVDKDDNYRNYPIVKNRNDGRQPKFFWSHEFVGGMDQEHAMDELEKSLYMIHSCRLADVKEPPLFPIAVNHPTELPIKENNEVRLVDRDVYCDPKYVDDEVRSRVLTPEEFDRLATFTYISKYGYNRVGFETFIKDSSIDKLSDLSRVRRVEEFAETFSSIIASVHKNDGRFSESYIIKGEAKSVSSLSVNNVSIMGVPHDWDTVSVGEDKDGNLKTTDLYHALSTLRVLCHRYDVFSKLGKSDVFKYRIRNSKPQSVVTGDLNLFPKAMELFIQKQKEILKDGFYNPVRLV